MDPSAVWRVLRSRAGRGVLVGSLSLGRLAYAGGEEWRRRVSRSGRSEKSARPRPWSLLWPTSRACAEPGAWASELRSRSWNGVPTTGAARPEGKRTRSNPCQRIVPRAILEHRLPGASSFGPPRPSRGATGDISGADRGHPARGNRGWNHHMQVRRLGDVRAPLVVRAALESSRSTGRSWPPYLKVPYMEKRCEPFWKQPPRELRLLLSYLG